ncbi:hypothetical protein D3C86_1680390 [compost metagenome]
MSAGRGDGRVASVEARLLLVDDLATGETALEQFLGAFELLMGKQLLTLAQLHIGLGGGEVFPGAYYFGFSLPALGFKGAGVHAGQQLTFGYFVAFVHQYFSQPAGCLAGDLHFSGFKSTIADIQPFRQSAQRRLPITKPPSRQ